MFVRKPELAVSVVLLLMTASDLLAQGSLSEFLIDGDGWEPTLATDGNGVVVVAWMDWNGSTKSIQRRRSTDRGATWESAGPTVSGDGPGVDPTVATNPANGDFYFGWQEAVNDVQAPLEVRSRRSVDGSMFDAIETLASGNVLDIDRPWLTASAYSVYGNWLQPNIDRLRFIRGVVDPFNGDVDWGQNPTVSYAVVSGGADKLAPPTPVVKGTGTTLFSLSKQVKNDDHVTGNAVRVHRALDEGVTWNVAGNTFTTFDNSPDGYWEPDDLGMFNMHVIADPASSNVWAFYVDYEARVCGDPPGARKVALLQCRKSTDSGTTWGDPVQVISNTIYGTLPCEPSNYAKLPDDDGNFVRDGYFRIARVWACRDAMGRLHVVWVDNREGKQPDVTQYPNRDFWRVYRSVSADGGSTWSAVVSAVSTANSLGGYGDPDGVVYAPPGHHLGCAADGQILYVTWPDSRHFATMTDTAGRIYVRRFALVP
ncbi:MAG: exo-alpha-sialidase [Phycisphaerales bacterium]|nr:exo-alpha-sialidase [Phycisphaerales bacterium]